MPPGTVLICEGIDQFGKDLIENYGKYWTVIESSNEDYIPNSNEVLIQSDMGYMRWILLKNDLTFKFEVL